MRKKIWAWICVKNIKIQYLKKMNEFRFSCLQSLAENRPPESNIMSLNQK